MIRVIQLVVVWLSSLGIVGVWQRHDGRMVAEARWQYKAVQEASNAGRQIQQAQDTARKAEQLSASRLVSVSEEFQRKLSNAKRTQDADVAAVRAGTLRLRDPGTVTLCAGADRAAEAGSGSGRCDGRAAGEFSDATAEFLLELTANADQVAEQLAACQKIVRADRSKE